ncbi:ABC transporter substrate-binding protein [Acidovorax sp. FJL06]|uniref:ABC transporter substrate-binding protein n=1 Tax=Acidovorax sp. FJL06 TaxID=2153365 RepID=UPI000F57FF7F|nr:extracellular solute-binding protein [Acidovorax sp. FJL06]RQO80929.1 ABC transporter substrate-binding protein [Acidovorax sp. FJL06]
MSARLHALAAAAIATATGFAHSGTVTIVTSFPKELTDTYRKAFEARHPGIQLEILSKNTKAGIAYLRETPVGQRPDVFWVSDPGAFEVLGRERLLQKVPEARNPLVPAKIGNHPVNDPDGLYFGQALSGYGIMTNKRYLQTHKLPTPKQWADLARPAYHGHVAISAPSRSGTTHLTVETILQGEGWDKGWRQLLQIGGNLAAVTDRSTSVPEGVNSGQYGIGIVVDFFGLAGRYSGFPVDFVYPSVTAVVPASIGLVAGARNADEGKKFIAYTLSQEGQELLFDPKVSRMPVLPYSVAGLKVPADFPNIYKVARQAKVQFNAELSEARYPLVTALFDQMITLRLKDLQAATLAIHEAETKLASRPHARGTELLHQARHLAYTPLVGDATVKHSPGVEEAWGAKARANYARAEELAKEALALAR